MDSVPLLVGFAVVCLAEVVVGAMLLLGPACRDLQLPAPAARDRVLDRLRPAVRPAARLRPNGLACARMSPCHQRPGLATQEGLGGTLRASFERREIEAVGTMAIFAARNPRPTSSAGSTPD